jgi:hypothetical protein
MKKSYHPILLTILAICPALPVFGGITYACNTSSSSVNPDTYAAGTCAYLNSTISGMYSSTFSNANANILIQMGTTGLGESTTGFFNLVSYNSYLTALTAEALASGNAVQISAVAALNAHDTAAYGGDNVEITSALAAALGITGGGPTGTILGVMADGTTQCTTPGSGGCYNGIITITTPAQLGSQGLFWDQSGGTQQSNQYDFYSVVEHETNEVLGTSSCISTTTTLTEDCDFAGGTGNPAAVDLYRYNSPGTLALDNACLGLTTCATSGAYFSFNGGATNGNPNGNIYNTSANGDDYADFIANGCGTGPYNVQDGTGCAGTRPFITTDGGAEVNILNAVGYDLRAGVPEPATIGLIGAGLALLAFARKRRA